MYDFLLQLIFFASLGLIIYLLARAVPRVDEVADEGYTSGKFDKILTRLPLREIDARTNVFFQKALRRMKVLIMKSDNVVDQQLKRLNKTRGSNGEKEIKPDLFGTGNGDTKE